MTRFWAITLALGTFASQYVPLLDVTESLETGTTVRIGTVSSVAALPMSVSVVEFVDQTYTVGQPFDFQVEVRNLSDAPIVIPWSNNPNGIDDVPDSDVFRASIGLSIANGSNREELLAAATIFGKQDTPSSVYQLTPGMSARFKARGTWSLGGLRMRDFIAPENGRVGIRAVYRLQTGTRLASTSASPFQPLTLSMP